MSQKWNLQDIKPVAPRKPRRPESANPEVVATPPEVFPDEIEEASENGELRIENSTKRKSKTLWVALLVFFLVLAIGAIFSILTGGAEITVHPRFKEPNINASFTAYINQQPEELSYSILPLEAEGERQVTATGQEEAKTQAEGTILIYNKEQTDPVRLVTNTRFETSDGLIFKIKDPAIIPGYTVGNNGEILPGVITADVYADEVGEEYNVDPTTFKIPGFAGEPEYDTIYAESIEQMSGGYNGTRFIIADDELETAKQALRLELRNSLLDQLEGKIPAGTAVIDGSVTFTYVSLPSVEYGENLATIKEKALLRVPLFNKSEFASYMAAASIPGYEGAPVRIENYDTFILQYESATTSGSDISTLDSLRFDLVGKPVVIWEYDEGKLKADLLNSAKTAVPVVLGGYPAIERAEAIIRPFWKTKFPTSLDDIEVIEMIDKE